MYIKRSGDIKTFVNGFNVMLHNKSLSPNIPKIKDHNNTPCIHANNNGWYYGDDLPEDLK